MTADRSTPPPSAFRAEACGELHRLAAWLAAEAIDLGSLPGIRPVPAARVLVTAAQCRAMLGEVIGRARHAAVEEGAADAS